MPRPKKGTPEYDLWIAAIEVATYPPLTNSNNQAICQVSVVRMKALRDALDAVGVDWREAKRKDDEQRQQTQKPTT